MAWLDKVSYEGAGEKERHYIDEQSIDLETANKAAIELQNAVVYESVEMNAWTMDDEVKEKVGGRYGDLIETAISVTNRSVVCSRYFTKITKERYGIDVVNDPDFRKKFDGKDAAVWDYGVQIATDIHGMTQNLKERLLVHFTQEQLVVLTGMAAVISADNIFESIIEID